MFDLKFNTKAVVLARLSEEEISDLANFDCGDSEINYFLQEEAFLEQEIGLNSTILLYYEGKLVAFCSLCCDSITLSKEERQIDGHTRYRVPAIKLARLGRDISWKGLGFGAYLVEYTKNLAFELSRSKLGVKYITIDAYENRIDFYAGLGFVLNQALKPMSNGAMSMRYNILP
ncbi:MAG: hypothetical protein PHP26_10430 [Syntrophomonas sp.]|uniref:hypothetical protein n=1 Tax=Syntrophomonas sp. TaxID=2053627 RepID=UPI0026317777|nr:hypothetical protein [Syntrophomonas sp.]MDD3880380.1 hypothetical protein [Syntrophomonas sp.]MDD4627093.1 hypothetical protein [Syntrophomonas sp.]